MVNTCIAAGVDVAAAVGVAAPAALVGLAAAAAAVAAGALVECSPAGGFVPAAAAGDSAAVDPTGAGLDLEEPPYYRDVGYL